MNPLQPSLLLLTKSPQHPDNQVAWQFANHFCQTWQSHDPNTPIALTLFLYADATSLANGYTWLPKDLDNPAKNWQALVLQYQILAQVCVSSALARGVFDAENGKRHQLVGENLAKGFQLVGLGELAMHLHQPVKLLQY